MRVSIICLKAEILRIPESCFNASPSILCYYLQDSSSFSAATFKFFAMAESGNMEENSLVA